MNSTKTMTKAPTLMATKKLPTKKKAKAKKIVQPGELTFKGDFEIRSDLIKDWTGETLVRRVHFKEESELLETIRDLVHDDELHNHQPIIRVEFFMLHFSAIKNEAESQPELKTFVAALQVEFESHLKKVERLTKNGETSFDTLPFMFKKNDVVVARDGDDEFAGTIDHFDVQESWTGKFFRLRMKMLGSNGKKFYEFVSDVKIPFFKDVKKLADLPVRPITPETMEKLVARGKKYIDLASGAHYMRYSGVLTQRSWWSDYIYRSDGRIMVDIANYKRQNPEGKTFALAYGRDDGSRDDGTGNTMDMMKIQSLAYATPPKIAGFSLTTKKWGEFSVDTIEKIEFRHSAFDLLVMDPEKKRLIKHIVQHGQSKFADIIDGKSGGTIFLLHGSPGTGKTLSAEAVAELLERPLYSISVGELGVTPSELEESLRTVLEISTAWNAVMLLDEADIFLEQRTKDDIVRNAMVGIFLRLLEYHQGVLFLTTNRVGEFDEAFHSRITIALKYPDLDVVAREQIWKNLLGVAKISIMTSEIKSLAKIDINGRQIKSSIRMAQSIADANAREVTLDDLKVAGNFSTDFKKVLNAPKVSK